MAYEIPYDSNYGEWYGQPQDVTRLSATLEQSLDEDGYPIGIITASWNMPDNGGTFVAQLSTDGTEYHIAETNIRQNSVVLVVEANTDYYLKIITVLGSEQSDGVVSSLLSSGVTIVPPTPTVVAVQGGMQINVGSVPFGYNAVISISDGTDTTVLYTTNMITIYNCDAGTYSVSTAYANASNDVGTSSSSVSVEVSELATADDYVEKTSADYIKDASVNLSGDILTLTRGDDTTVTFQGGGGGGSAYSETELYYNASGVSSGNIPLNGNISNYNFITFKVWDGNNSNSENNYVYTSSSITNAISNYGLLSLRTGSGGVIWKPSGNNYDTITIVETSGSTKIYRITGINVGGSGGGGGSYTAGDGIDITSNVISLETASANDLGGIKVGTNLSIDGNGVLSATDTTYTDFVGSGASASSGLVPAPPTTAGTSKYLREDGTWATPSGGGGGGGSYTAGDGIDITNDVISLETASANSIGGIKVGSGLSIDGNGVLSVTGGVGGTFASIDTTNLIYTIYDDMSNWATNVDVTYTATVNCFIVGHANSYFNATPSKTVGVGIYINDVLLQQITHSATAHSSGAGIFLPLAAGDTVRLKTLSGSIKAYLYAYGVKYT